jgi:orotate phosphoribosyltransferase-like protein
MPRGRGHKMRYPERAELIRRALEMHSRGISQREIAGELDLSRGTISVWMRRYGDTPQRRIAAEIRRALVCCNIYEQLSALVGDTEAWRVLRHSNDYHDICYYGEWSALIAEKTRV